MMNVGMQAQAFGAAKLVKVNLGTLDDRTREKLVKGLKLTGEPSGDTLRISLSDPEAQRLKSKQRGLLAMLTRIGLKPGENFRINKGNHIDGKKVDVYM